MTGHPTENVPTCLQKPPHTSHQLKRKAQKLEKDGNFPLEHTFFTHRPKSQEERIKRTYQTRRSQKAGRKTKKAIKQPGKGKYMATARSISLHSFQPDARPGGKERFSRIRICIMSERHSHTCKKIVAVTSRHDPYF